MDLSKPPPFLELPIHRVIDCNALWGEYPEGSEKFELARELPSTVKLETIVRWEAMKILEANGIHMTSSLLELLALHHANSGNTPVREASDRIVEEIGENLKELNPAGSSDIYNLTTRSLSLTQLALSLEPRKEIDSLEKYRHHLDKLYALANVEPTTMKEKMAIIRECIGGWQVSYRGAWREHPLEQLQFELIQLEYLYLDEMNLFEGEDAVHHYC